MEKRRENVLDVWSWSEHALDESHPFLKLLDYGIGAAGAGYNTRQPSELHFLITLMQRWKAEGDQHQATLLSDPWSFGNWLDTVPKTGERQFRHMLLYLVFPDTYERISSRGHKRDIVSAFSDLPTSHVPVAGDSDAITVDRKLRAIRSELEKEYPEQEVDFYRSPVKERWQAEPPPPWIDAGERA